MPSKRASWNPLVAFLLMVLVLLAKQLVSFGQISDHPNLSLHTAKKIVVIGSSTAYGTGATPVDSSWVNRLRQHFLKYNSLNQVINLAVGGYTTFQLLPTGQMYAGRPAADTLKNCTAALKYKPDLVIINLPTNDIAAGHTNEEILRNYGLITHSLVLMEIPYFITSTQPRDFNDALHLSRIKELDVRINRAYPGQMIDYLLELSNSDYSIKHELSAGDGIHLNNRGHGIIYQHVINLPFYLALARSSQ